MCAGCGGTSDQKAWGAHVMLLSPDQKTILHQKPHGSACQECKEAAYVAQLPRRTHWDELEPKLQDPKNYSAFRNWCALRSGAKAPRFVPQGAKEVTKMGYRWEDAYQLLTTAEFQRRFPGMKYRGIPGVRVETLHNSRGEPEEVILIKGSEPPRLVVYHQVDVQLEDNHLLPQAHLRKEQGPEFWAQLLTKARHAQPREAPTMEELDEMVRKAGGHVRPQTPREQRPRARAAFGSPAESRAGTAGSHEFFNSPRTSAADTRASFSSPTDTRGAPDATCSDGEKLVEQVVEDEDEDIDQGEVPPSRNDMELAAPFPPAHDGGSRRRLRVSNSNPDQPPQPKKKPRAKAKAGNLPATGPLTVEAVLKGEVQHPKKEIYHKRQQLPALKKSGDALAILAEEELLTALGAAERLQPSEIARLPDSELMPSLKVVLKQIQPSQLPAPTLLGLVRRKALTCIEQPQELVATLWPITEGDPATKVQEFDPYKPRMCEPYTKYLDLY